MSFSKVGDKIKVVSTHETEFSKEQLQQDKNMLLNEIQMCTEQINRTQHRIAEIDNMLLLLNPVRLDTVSV